MELYLAIAGLSLIVVSLLAWPLFRQRPIAEDGAFDIEVYRDQLRELDHDHERGLLNDEQAELARREIERRLLAADARRTKASDDSGPGGPNPTSGAGKVNLHPPLIAILLIIPLFAVGWYVGFGEPDAPDQPFAARNIQPDVQEVPENVVAMVEQLEARLAESPEDETGWRLLARSLFVMQRFMDARNAFIKVWELSNDPMALSDAAEIDVILNGNVVTPQVLDLFLAVRGEHPLEPKPRYYIGLAYVQAGDVRRGIAEWTDLLHLSPPDAPWIPSIRQQLQAAANEAGIDPASVEPSDAVVDLAERLGAPGPTQEDIDNAAEMTPEEQMTFIRSMVQNLAERLESNPNDREGWRRLAQAYRVLGEPDKAAEAMRRADEATQ